jgi:hypothetical protein
MYEKIKEFDKISYFEYLINPFKYIEKRNDLLNNYQKTIKEVYDLVNYENINPQKELNDITKLLENKNIDIIILSRVFLLEDSLTLNTQHPIRLSHHLNETVALEGNTITNLRKTSSKLKFIITKESDLIEIIIERS